MSNIKLNCFICGKELGLGNRVSSDGVLWRCEDCARKLMEEYDNKDQKIKDLEHRLANCIEPKFKVGQDVYTIRHNNSIYHTRIDEIRVVGINGKNEIFYYYDQPGGYAHWEEVEYNLFATEEEARKRLEELKGE